MRATGTPVIQNQLATSCSCVGKFRFCVGAGHPRYLNQIALDKRQRQHAIDHDVVGLATSTVAGNTVQWVAESYPKIIPF